MWAHSGRELFFLSDNRELVSAAIVPGPPFSIGTRTILFSLEPEYYFANFSTSYRVTRDDQRFLMMRAWQDDTDPEVQPRLILVDNWFAELEEKLRTR